MAERRLGQLSLADAIAARPSRSSVKLDRLGGLIDWRQVAEAVKEIRGSRYGAPGYPALLMVKALLLQQWYGLSDEGLEDALADRMSFRRFVGLSLAEKAPDHTAIWRFREELARRGLAAALFAEVTRQIERKGLVVRHGTMVDATLIEAQVKRPKPPKDEPPADGDGEPAPDGAGSAAVEGSRASEAAGGAARPPSKLVGSPTDPDASWAKKGGTRHFGYKGHVGVDQGSRIIRRAKLTTASVPDTLVFEELLSGDEDAVYADKAYDKKARRAALKARGVKDRIAHRGNKHHPITARQERRNAGIGRRRYQVEQVFACAKRLYGWTRVRYRGLVRNAGHFCLVCTALNLDRMLVLTR
jgi:IS5 family transposase